VRYLGHDDASRVTRENVVGFKDHRLSSVNPRNGRRISARTVNDSDLVALKTIFGWAKANGKIDTNPAEGVTIKLGKQPQLRSKGFTVEEAEAILTAALNLSRGQEKPKTLAAKRWVPWLCAYTGARVGELAQLRKKDIRHDGAHWIATITPEPGTVKTNEARDVVLHEHLEELGFIAFVKGAAASHLFLTPSASGAVLGPWRGSRIGSRSSSARWCPTRTLRRTMDGGTASRLLALRPALSTASLTPFRVTVRGMLLRDTAR